MHQVRYSSAVTHRAHSRCASRASLAASDSELLIHRDLRTDPKLERVRMTSCSRYGICSVTHLCSLLLTKFCKSHVGSSLQPPGNNCWSTCWHTICFASSLHAPEETIRSHEPESGETSYRSERFTHTRSNAETSGMLVPRPLCQILGHCRPQNCQS